MTFSWVVRLLYGDQLPIYHYSDPSSLALDRAWPAREIPISRSIHTSNLFSTAHPIDSPPHHPDMQTIVPRRPILNLSFLLPSSFCLQPLQQVPRRNESSARRLTKKLRVKPHPSFTPLTGNTPSPSFDHVVFNPPASAPSPYHTPPIFLPHNDPRRKLLMQAYDHANPYQQPDRRLSPPVRQPYEKKYHLSAEQIEEIRKLRTDDPFTWTRAKLAEKFGCSQFFVGMVVEASKERKDWARQQLDNVKAKWGKRRKYAREDRAKRRELWAKDA
ncbi:MAG: hypothetical protein MMC33_001645 [Icmadophila ericetorum]|nr:hypothetical protein [Icmadophila ericetorum]